MHNRDNNFTLGNPTLIENPTTFLRRNYSSTRFTNQQFVLVIYANNPSQIPVKLGQNICWSKQPKIRNSILVNSAWSNWSAINCGQPCGLWSTVWMCWPPAVTVAWSNLINAVQKRLSELWSKFYLTKIKLAGKKSCSHVWPHDNE